MRFSSKTRLIQDEIIPALGEHAEDFDLDTIADEAFEVHHELHNGREVGDPYWQQREGVDFWEVVERHAL